MNFEIALGGLLFLSAVIALVGVLVALVVCLGQFGSRLQKKNPWYTVLVVLFIIALLYFI